MRLILNRECCAILFPSGISHNDDAIDSARFAAGVARAGTFRPYTHYNMVLLTTVRTLARSPPAPFWWTQPLSGARIKMHPPMAQRTPPPPHYRVPEHTEMPSRSWTNQRISPIGQNRATHHHPYSHPKQLQPASANHPTSQILPDQFTPLGRRHSHRCLRSRSNQLRLRAKIDSTCRYRGSNHSRRHSVQPLVRRPSSNACMWPHRPLGRRLPMRHQSRRPCNTGRGRSRRSPIRAARTHCDRSGAGARTAASIAYCDVAGAAVAPVASRADASGRGEKVHGNRSRQTPPNNLT